MAVITLITANKNYCNWPLPAWLCLRVADLDINEVIIPFRDPDTRDRFGKLTPTRSVDNEGRMITSGFDYDLVADVIGSVHDTIMTGTWSYCGEFCKGIFSAK